MRQPCPEALSVPMSLSVALILLIPHTNSMTPRTLAPIRRRMAHLLRDASGYDVDGRSLDAFLRECMHARTRCVKVWSRTGSCEAFARVRSACLSALWATGVGAHPPRGNTVLGCATICRGCGHEAFQNLSRQAGAYVDACKPRLSSFRADESGLSTTYAREQED